MFHRTTYIVEFNQHFHGIVERVPRCQSISSDFLQRKQFEQNKEIVDFLRPFCVKCFLLILTFQKSMQFRFDQGPITGKRIRIYFGIFLSKIQEYL